MFERMLDKKNKPTIGEMENYCGVTKELFIEINKWLSEQNLVSDVVFPYGNSYGWGIKYAVKTNLFCNVFPEDNSFTGMLRLTEKQCSLVYPEVKKETKTLIDNKYPCSNGGWIHFRINSEEQLDDLKIMLKYKLKKGSK